MNKGELRELIGDFHDMDEVCLVSPGGKEMRVTGIDPEIIARTGKIVLTTEWGMTDEGDRETLKVIPRVRKPYKKKKKTAARKKRSEATKKEGE